MVTLSQMKSLTGWVLFLVLGAAPINSAWAMMCRKPNDFIVAKCNAEHCSKAFEVTIEWAHHECNLLYNVDKPDIAKLKAFRKTTSELSKNEVPIIFFHLTDCLNRLDWPGEFQFTSYEGKKCFAVVESIVLKGNWKEELVMRYKQGDIDLRIPFDLIDLEKTSYDKLLKHYEKTERWSYIEYALTFFLMPFLIYPFIIYWLSRFAFKVCYSSKSLLFRISATIPLFLLQLIVLITAMSGLFLAFPGVPVCFSLIINIFHFTELKPKPLESLGS